MKKLLCMLLLCNAIFLFAQTPHDRFCGIVEEPKNTLLATAFSANAAKYSGSVDPAVLAAYPSISFDIYFWIITDGRTATNITEEVLLQNIKRVNEIYNPIGIGFVLKGYDTIINSSIYEKASWGAIKKATSKNVIPNSFNVYIPRILGAGNGVTDFGASRLAVNQSHTLGTFGATLGNTLAHELAHCFNLYHPWGPSNGQIYTEENNTRDPADPNYNALTKGDMIHDTAAMASFFTEAKKFHDDNISAVVDADCNYSGSMTDGLGAPLEVTPFDVGNVMSYTRGSCVHGFTVGQGIRIREYIAGTPNSASVQAMRSDSQGR